MNILKNKNGITLIALIITVIVLIILAVFVISNITNSGALNKTSEAGKKAIIAQEKEQISLAVASLGIDIYSNKDSKLKKNSDSGFEVEAENENVKISVYANEMARELNMQAETLNNTLKTSGTQIPIAQQVIGSAGVYQKNKKGILVWDYDRQNDEDYVLTSDWVKVRFENRGYMNLYIVNKWTGEIVEEQNLFIANFPLTEPGSYYFTVDAQAQAKWLYMKKFDERIPEGANIVYKIFVSDDKNTWQQYSSIPEIDKNTRYMRIFVDLIPNDEGESPRLGGLTVKFKRLTDVEQETPEDVGELILEETSNIIATENGYTPENITETAVVTQKVTLSKPMTPTEILQKMDYANESENGGNYENSNVSTSVFVSNNGSTWIPIEEADSNIEYPYAKVKTTILPAQEGNSEPGESTGGNSGGTSTGTTPGSSQGTQGGDNSISDINNPNAVPTPVIGIISVNPQGMPVEELDIEIWKTTDVQYYYAIADGPSTWVKLNVDETIPEGTRIVYSSAKSNDGDSWSGYSKDITANNDSEYVKVKVEFQTKDATKNAKLNEIEIICNYNGEEVRHIPTQSKEFNFTVSSQNTNFGTVSDNSGKYKYNTSITVTATPKDGYQLVGWSDGNGIVSKQLTYSFNMPKKDYQLNAIWISNAASLGEVLVYDEHTTFVVVTNPKTWKSAQSMAASYGGRLAVIDSKAKQDLIYSKVRSVGDAWIGLTDEATEGVWLYTDGRAASIYSNWNSGEPNNAGNEDYAEMYMSTGKWNDLNGTQSYPFIMEFNN